MVGPHNLEIGFNSFFRDFDPEPFESQWMRAAGGGDASVLPLHFSSGITVLALSLVRVIWRLTHRPPALQAGLWALERFGSHAVHLLFYVMMLALPLTGWSIISAHPPKAVVAWIWGVLPLPQIAVISHLQAPVQRLAHDDFVRIHSILGWVTLSMLALHVAGALKHQFFDRQPELERMGVG